jgi:hypothetical protein
MKVGKIISVGTGPKRNVEIRIASDELFSELADPPGALRAADVTAVCVAEQQAGERCLLHLYLDTAAGKRVRFYTAETQFDIALLLDELEAALGERPRTWTKAEPNA